MITLDCLCPLKQICLSSLLYLLFIIPSAANTLDLNENSAQSNSLIQASSQEAEQKPLSTSSVDESQLGQDSPEPLDLFAREVNIGLAGTIQLDIIHDFNALGLDPQKGVLKEFITGEIPVSGTPAAKQTNRTGFSPNQSKLELWADTQTNWGTLKGYAEVNLFGDPIDPELQIYKVYGEWGWFKGGLDYTPWLNQATIPDTLDFEGPNAIPEPRNTQVILTIPLKRLSHHDLNGYIVLGAEDASFEPTSPLSVTDVSTSNQIPALIGKLGFAPSWAQLELAGLYRRLRAQGDNFDASINGWGVMLDGYFKTVGEDNLILGILYGKAIGAYIDDTQGFDLDAAPTSSIDPTLKAIPAFGSWVGYQHWWTQALRSTASYGYVRLNNQFDQTPNPMGTFHKSQYVQLNVVYSPIPSVDVGIEYLYGLREVTANTAINGQKTGHDNRIQATIRWNFQAIRSL